MKFTRVKNPLSMRKEIFSVFVAAFASNIFEQTEYDGLNNYSGFCKHQHFQEDESDED